MITFEVHRASRGRDNERPCDRANAIVFVNNGWVRYSWSVHAESYEEFLAYLGEDIIIYTSGAVTIYDDYVE